MGGKATKYRIVIMASGGGSNAQRMMEHFRKSEVAEVCAVLSDNPRAGVLARAEAMGIVARVMPRSVWSDGAALRDLLQSLHADFIALAGYLRQIPTEVVHYYRGLIVNIHPSLLPAYGGKGMYGIHVHEAVIAAGDKKSGLTIHLVDDEYDTGEILFRHEVEVPEGCTPQQLQDTVLACEHRYYPEVIEKLIRKLKTFRR